MADEAKKETMQPAPATAASDAGTKATTGADSTSGAKPAASASGGFGDMLPMLVGMMLIFYFLLIRPEKKRRDAQLALVNAMKKNDKVVLSSGIYGTIADIDGDDVYIITDPKSNFRMRVRKDSIGTILTPEEKDKK